MSWCQYWWRTTATSSAGDSATAPANSFQVLLVLTTFMRLRIVPLLYCYDNDDKNEDDGELSGTKTQGRISPAFL